MVNHNFAEFNHNLTRYVVRQLDVYQNGVLKFEVLWSIYYNQRLQNTRTKVFDSEQKCNEYYKIVLNNIVNHLPV